MELKARTYLLLLGLLAFTTPRLHADLIGFQSFENYTSGGVYTDTFNPATDHDLINNAGEAPVDGVATLTDTIGFDSSYRNTRDGIGLGDGDDVGVVNSTGTVGSYTDGVQGFQLNDPDGLMRTDFDALNITDLGDVTLTFDFFVEDSSYEANDVFTIGAIVDGVDTTLLELEGDELENRGSWETLMRTFNGDSVQVYVELDANSQTESVYLDNMAFNTATGVPEPSSLGLAALGLLTLAASARGKIRRRRSGRP